MKPTIALLAAIILCPMAAAAEPAHPPAQARVLGKIPDGTPPPPAPPKPPFTVDPSHILDSSIKREGGRNVLVQRIAPLALPPPPAPKEYPTAINPETFRAKLAAYHALHPRPLLVGIGATVYRAAGKPTLTRITCHPLDGKSANQQNTFWSTADFSLLAGLNSIADAEGRTYEIFMMWGVIDLDRNNASRRARGLQDLPFPNPALPSRRAGTASFITENPAPSPTALNIVKALHEIHDRDFSALLAARERRDQARAAREQWLKANPPQPKDIILNHWDLGESRPVPPPPQSPAIPARSRSTPRRRSPRNRKPKAGIQNPKTRSGIAAGDAGSKIQNSLLLAILVLTTLALTAPRSLAILDLDGNGISDIVEQAWNGGTPPSQPYDPAANPDGDLWNNALEATAGTDPFSGDPDINGFLTPATEFVPAVYGDEDNDGIDELLSPETLLLTWTSVPGKAYQVFFSSTLTTDSWTEVAWTELDPPRIAVGSQLGKAIPLTQENGAKPDKLFFRIAVTDVDSDYDNLSDAEEEMKETDPLKPDTDADGVRDYDELAETHTNPLLADDLDLDGMADDLEKHLALQFLAVHPDPLYWGTFFSALAAGDLAPTHDYTGDGAAIATLVPTLTAIAECPPSESGFLVEAQSRSNSLHAHHWIWDPANNPEGEVGGQYTYSRPNDWDDAYELNQLADLTPDYLTSRITGLVFDAASNPAVIPLESGSFPYWSEAWAGFDVGPEPDGSTLYCGRIRERKFRLVADRPDHRPLSKHFLKVTSKHAYLAYEPTEILETDPVTIDLPPGRLATEWIEIQAPMTTGQDTVVKLVPVEIVVPKPAPNGGYVTGDYVPASELKVAKMQDSLTVLKNYGEITREDLEIAKDADRFYIRYTGGAILAQLGDASATLSTRECSDPTYNDDPTEMDLTQIGDDLISASMILVSDHTDDDYAGDFVNVADDQRNDPTHIVQLGGKVRLNTVKIGSQTHTINLDLPVKKKRKVTAEFIILDDGEIDIADMTATVERDLKAANERYAQVGVEIVKGSLNVKPVPTGLDLPDGKLLVEKISLTDRELSDDIKRIIDAYGTNNNLDDIHVFYVPMTLWRNPVADTDGVGLNNIYAPLNPGYQYNVFIEKMAYPYGLAHELGHILTDDRHPLVTDFVLVNQGLLEKLSVNLMFDGVTYELKPRDSKRLWDIQEKVIQGNQHATPVQP